MIDRAIAIVGLGVTILLGLYTFAPPEWPKLPPVAMLSGMGVGLFLFGIGVGLIIGDYRRLHLLDFDIEFDPSDRRFVEIDQERIVYSIGLRNLSHRSIFFVSIRTPHAEFADRIFKEDTQWAHAVGTINIFIAGVLDPDALEFFRLFDLPVEDKFIHRDVADLLSRRHRFTLEARGRDAKTYSADFEYDPSKFPRLRKC